MTPRLTTTVSTLVAGLLLASGAALLFLPDEIAAALGLGAAAALPLAVLSGAVFGLGMLDWMTRGNPLGGIYGRPVVVANLAHFLIGGITLLKQAAGSVPLLVVGAVYLAGAVFYGALFFRSPTDAG